MSFYRQLIAEVLSTIPCAVVGFVRKRSSVDLVGSHSKNLIDVVFVAVMKLNPD